MATVNGTNVNFVKVNTQSQYNDLTKQDGTIYFVVSEKKIYLDGVGYGMSDEDAANFLSIDGGTLNGQLYINDEDFEWGRGLGVSFVLPDGESRRIEPYGYSGGTDKGVAIQVGETSYEFGEGRFTILSGQGDAPIKISGVADPVDYTDAVNMRFLDNQITPILDMKGSKNGLAELDANGTVPTSQLPSYVDDVVEGANQASFPEEGEAGKIYVSLDNNKTWRWTGSIYTEISSSLALGETSATAYRGDRGKIAYDHLYETDNPHQVTKAQVGLSSVGNYGLATQAEAEAGTSAVKYMTPQRTKQAIEKLAPKLSWTVVA